MGMTMEMGKVHKIEAEINAVSKRRIRRCQRLLQRFSLTASITASTKAYQKHQNFAILKIAKYKQT
jgi:hypothetical protein